MKGEYYAKIRKNLMQYYSEELGLSDVERRIEKRINRERGKYRIDKLDKLINIQNKKLLDVGSGWGEYVVEAYERGAIAYGVDPDAELLEISNLLIGKRGIFRKGYAEKVPFEDNSFDIVICCDVLEHVNDPRESIREMMRVLKEGGSLYLLVPNYLYPREAHYKIRWVPLMPKSIAKIYLRLLRRNPSFIESINYITPLWLLKELKRYDVLIRNLTMEEMSKNWNNKSIVKKLALKIIMFFHIYPVIELLIKKK